MIKNEIVKFFGDKTKTIIKVHKDLRGKIEIPFKEFNQFEETAKIAAYLNSLIKGSKEFSSEEYENAKQIIANLIISVHKRFRGYYEHFYDNAVYQAEKSLARIKKSIFFPNGPNYAVLRGGYNSYSIHELVRNWFINNNSGINKRFYDKTFLDIMNKLKNSNDGSYDSQFVVDLSKNLERTRGELENYFYSKKTNNNVSKSIDSIEKKSYYILGQIKIKRMETLKA